MAGISGQLRYLGEVVNNLFVALLPLKFFWIVKFIYLFIYFSEILLKDYCRRYTRNRTYKKQFETQNGD